MMPLETKKKSKTRKKGKVIFKQNKQTNKTLCSSYLSNHNAEGNNIPGHILKDSSTLTV